MAKLFLNLVPLAILVSMVEGGVDIVVSSRNLSYGDKVQVSCLAAGLTSAGFSLNGESVGSCYDANECHVAGKLEQNISLSWNVTSNSAVLTVNKLTSDLCGQYGCIFRDEVASTTVAYSDFRNLQVLKSYEPTESTGGLVSMVTDCFLPSATDQQDVQWSTVDSDGHEETISPSGLFIWKDKCSCNTECNSQYREKLTTGFRHQEVPCDNATPTQSVRYKVTITSRETGHTMRWTSTQSYTVRKIIPTTTTTTTTKTTTKPKTNGISSSPPSLLYTGNSVLLSLSKLFGGIIFFLIVL